MRVLSRRPASAVSLAALCTLLIALALTPAYPNLASAQSTIEKQAQKWLDSNCDDRHGNLAEAAPDWKDFAPPCRGIARKYHQAASATTTTTAPPATPVPPATTTTAPPTTTTAPPTTAPPTTAPPTTAPPTTAPPAPTTTEAPEAMPLWSTTMTVGSWSHEGKVRRLGFQSATSLGYGSLSNTSVADGDETYRVGVLSWFTFASGTLYVIAESPHEDELADLWSRKWLSCSADGDVVLSAQMRSRGTFLQIDGVVDDGTDDAPWADSDTVACEVWASEPGVPAPPTTAPPTTAPPTTAPPTTAPPTTTVAPSSLTVEELEAAWEEAGCLAGYGVLAEEATWHAHFLQPCQDIAAAYVQVSTAPPPAPPLWSTTMTVGSWEFEGKVHRLGFQTSLAYGSLSNTSVADGDKTYRVDDLWWDTFGSGSLYMWGARPHMDELADLWHHKWLSCSVDGDVVLSAQMSRKYTLGSNRVGYLRIDDVVDDGTDDAPWADGDTVVCDVLASEPGVPAPPTTAPPTTAPPTTAPPTTAPPTTAPPTTAPPEPPVEQVTSDEMRAQAEEKLTEAGELEPRAAALETQASELADDAANARMLAANRIASAEKKEAKARKRPAQADRLLSQAAKLRERAAELNEQAAGIEASAARLTQQADGLRTRIDSLRAEAAELNTAADELDASTIPLWSTTMTVGTWRSEEWPTKPEGEVDRLGYQAWWYGSLSNASVADGDKTYTVSDVYWSTFASGDLTIFADAPYRDELADLWHHKWLSCSVDGDVVLSAQMRKKYSLGSNRVGYLRIDGTGEDGDEDAPWADGDTVVCEVFAAQPASA